jgi:hypothetical protein
MRDKLADIADLYEQTVRDAFASDLIGAGRRVIETRIAAS